MSSESTELRDKIAVVTGGSKGIGLAIAREFLDAGMRVAICGRSEGALAEARAALAPQERLFAATCDVGRFEEVERFVGSVLDRWGGVDVLVNNAGVGRFQPVDQISVEDWRAVIDTNLSGPFYCVKAVTPSMRARGGGFILNIGSLAGKNPFAGGAAYNASKFGLNGFSEAMMLDLRHDGIRVSQIMPGSVQTDFQPGGGGPEGEWKLSPEQIAETALHLIRMPQRNLASRIEMRPSTPPKR